MENDLQLLNMKGEPWTLDDKPRTADDRVELVISLAMEPSEALEPFVEKLRRLEKIEDLKERCVAVRETLSDISRLAGQLGKVEEKRENSPSID